jgi:hypothetical protein
MTARDNLNDMKGRHRAHVHDDVCRELSRNRCYRAGVCERCTEAYPCDAARLIALTEAVLNEGASYKDNPWSALERIAALAEQHLGGNHE